MVLLLLFAATAAAIGQTGVAIFPIGGLSSGLTGEAAIAGPVKDADKALTVARPILVSVYGKQKIQSEEPLIASLAGDVWLVEGSMHCPASWWQKLFHLRPMCVGGTAELKLSAETGAVLSVTHYQ
jgi:hypothetical protein